MLSASVHLNRPVVTTITLFKQQHPNEAPFVRLAVSDSETFDIYVADSNAARTLANALNQSADILDTANTSAAQSAQPCV